MPNAATSLSVTIAGRTSARLNWIDGAANAWNEIYRGTVDDITTASFVAMVAQGVQVYMDAALSEGTAYFWWVKARTSADTFAAATASVTGTTLGASGNPGTDIVNQIVTAGKERLANLLSSDYKQLEYARDLRKNNKINRDRGFGFVPADSIPGDASVFQSYTQTQAFEVVLTRGVVPGKGDRQIEVAEQEIYQWADRIIRDFKHTNLYKKDIIVRIADPSASAPEYLEDMEMVAIRYRFPITYRNSLL